MPRIILGEKCKRYRCAMPHSVVVTFSQHNIGQSFKMAMQLIKKEIEHLLWGYQKKARKATML